ncbi:MAG: nitrilase-related carbon-nitrogen hydrolase, partial [Aquabacterium sp.]
MTVGPTHAAPAPPPALRLAIAQPPMAWTTAENTDTALAMLSAAAAVGAALCVFPELMVTGFHRRIAQEARPEVVGPALQRIAQACADHRIAASVGAPCFGTDGAILNSQLLFDSGGQLVATTDKRGLTAP